MPDLALNFELPVRESWSMLTGEPFDLLVIGGGIHGAGVARDAALRGLRTVVIEQGDWASGTSSRSSKLLHGGLRYLQHGHVRMVRESLRERNLHARLAPEAVRPLRFRVPDPPPAGTALWKIRTGIALYGAMTGGWSTTRFWSGEPSYTDAQIDDARFVLDVIRDARRNGAVAAHYTRWLDWVRSGDRVTGARIRDRFTGAEGIVKARVAVNAAGPWAETLHPRAHESRLRLTRGTHVVLEGSPGDARLFFSPEDGRVLFVLPLGTAHALVGTTDLDEPAVLEDPVPRAEEVGYLARAFRNQFPKWGGWEPVGLQCGLRPLVAGGGDPSSVSREERVEEDPVGGVISILGGKYTTFRAVAERVVDRVERRLGRPIGLRPTRFRPLPHGEPPAGEDASAWAMDQEEAVRMDDIFLRRTSWGLIGADREHGAEARAAWSRRWGASEASVAEEWERYQERRRLHHRELAEWSKNSGEIPG